MTILGFIFFIRLWAAFYLFCGEGRAFVWGFRAPAAPDSEAHKNKIRAGGGNACLLAHRPPTEREGIT